MNIRTQSRDSAGGADSRRPRLLAFTLIELLIATAVFAMVLIAMNTVFHGALQLRKTTSRVLEEAIPINHVVALMKSDLRSMIPPGATGVLAGPVLGGRESALQGGRMGRSMNDFTFLEFTASSGVTDDSPLSTEYGLNEIQDVLPWPEAQKVSYYLREPLFQTGVPGMELVRTITRNLLAANDEYPIEQPLLEGVEAMEFLFYDGTEWMDVWNSTNQDIAMPRAVKVIIDFAARDPNERYIKPPVEFVVPILTQTITNQVDEAESETGQGGETGGGSEQNGGQQQGGGAGGGGNPGGGGQAQPPGGGR